ncbi:MAG: hypothetical protein RIS64_4165 [Bacteroidota bacterium]|jgi:hypothetical protein
MNLKMRQFGLLLLISTTLSAQSPKMISGIDKAKIDLWEQERANELKVTPFLQWKGDSAFRFFNGRQFVEILYDQGKKTGRIISFGREYKPYDSEKKRTKPRKVHFRASYLERSQLVRLDSLITGSQIRLIPTGDSLKKWQFGCDGIVYQMESTNPKNYVFQSYWTPEVQDSTLIEAKQVEHFAVQMKSILNLEAEWNQFINHLPSGAYFVGTMSVVTTQRTFQHNVKAFWRRMFSK